MEISVIGLGYIGLPTAIAFASNGYRVLGYDVNEKAVDMLNEGHLHIVENGLQDELQKVINSCMFSAHHELQEADVYIICVPTPFHHDTPEKTADLSYVEAAAREVGRILKLGDLVILESTVPPYTTRKMTDILCEVSGLGRDEFYTAHCPERVLPGHILYELSHNDRIIGAEKKDAALKAKWIYESFLKEGTAHITDDLTAEMCKLVENSFRDVNIAFANELSILCDDLGIDVNRLIELANKHPRVQILNPGVGVGGHCISVDPWFIIEKFGNEAKLISAARNINDSKPFFVADKIEERLKNNKSKTVAILGLAFKANIDDLRESPSIILAEELKNRGYDVIACEPNTEEKEKNGIKIYSLDEVLEKADLSVLTVKHDVFMKNLDKIEEKEHLIV